MQDNNSTDLHPDTESLHGNQSASEVLVTNNKNNGVSVKVMKTENPVILKDSDEAATYKTDIEGWVSADGIYYGKGASAEQAARWAGCTHVVCECGELVPKACYTSCDKCRKVRAISIFSERKTAPWEDSKMLHSKTHDRYFDDPDEFEEWLADQEEPATLHPEKRYQVYICEPRPIGEIEPDQFIDDLPEDGELPAEVIMAMEAFNAVIRNTPPQIWYPSKVAWDGERKPDRNRTVFMTGGEL